MSAAGCDNIALMPCHRSQDGGSLVAPDFLALRQVPEVPRVPVLMLDNDPLVSFALCEQPTRARPQRARMTPAAIRKHGYDVDADTKMLSRHGVNVN